MLFNCNIVPLEDAEYQFIPSPTVGVAVIVTVPVPQRDAFPAVGDEGTAFTVAITEVLDDIQPVEVFESSA